MADKMMRIAGRGHDGTAKPISLDKNGVVKTSQTLQVNRPLEPKELVQNEEYKSGSLSTEGFTKGTLNLRMSNERPIEVYIQYSGADGVPTGYKNLVYRSEGTESAHQITFPLIETRFELTIKHIGTGGNNGVTNMSVLTLSNDDDVLTDIRNLKDETVKFKQDIMENLTDEVNKKKPLNTLFWKKTATTGWRDFTIGYDGRHYLITYGRTVKVYDHFIDGEEVETGITLPEEAIDIRRFYVFPEGVTYFVTTADEEVAIYHAKDIHTQPTVVFQSSTQTNSRFARTMGIDGYTDGINSIILAGVYGAGADKKPLVLSTDGGKTFKTVKETQNIDTESNYNSHWHDVAIDPYHGYLWAGEGDGPINRAIWYSDDLGETWNKIETSAQPTSIDVFPDRVNLGRDSHRVGTDVMKKHNLLAENMVVEPLREFKNQVAWSYYANAAVVKGNEGYMNFTLYDGSTKPMIVGTGDGGISWHGLSFGVDNISQLYAIDDTYVYARDADARIVYSERIKWG